MIAILSPAKNMRRVTSPLPPTTPLFLPQTLPLLQALRQYNPRQLEQSMKISPALALHAFTSFADMQPEQPGTPALLAYDGLQYKQLGATDFSRAQLNFAQQHLRILSGFYGLLRPLDGIWPYRLELGGTLKFGGKSLYAYWGAQLATALFAAGEPVINLCSAEYAKAVTPFLLPGQQFITIDFLQQKPGRKLVMQATAAKMARGRMARFVVQNKVTRPVQLQKFSWGGYQYAKALSTPQRWAFVRGED
ncbi:MAG: uncharacterized protein PWQ08_369 [Clostridiales bacterium]|jgi:hypothetical protein|nr:peroxide stress protein YaaA [Pygmaiobacter sp.]MDK2813114.1 uncharacterized protein [Clostridiales bacterium]